MYRPDCAVFQILQCVSLPRVCSLQEVESKEMQRRWIQVQTELVTLQNENTASTETVTRMHAEQTVLTQKKRRLEATIESHTKEIRALDQAMGRLHVQLQRVNALIAENASAREALAEDNLSLQTQVACDLKDMELEAAKLTSQIEEGKQQKRDVLAEMIEVERQVGHGGLTCNHC